MTELEAQLAASLEMVKAGKHPTPGVERPAEPSPKGETGIGGTDAAAVLHFYEPHLPEDLVKWQNASDLWLRLVHGVSRPRNKAMERGIKVEPQLLAIYARDIEPLSPMVSKVVRHPKHSWAKCSPDGIGQTSGAVVEMKTTSVFAQHLWGEPMTDLMPNSYLLQCIWNCAITDRPRAHLLVAFGKDFENEQGEPDFAFTETRVYRVERDAELEARLLTYGERFYREFVETRMPPPLQPVNSRREFKRLVGSGK